MMNSMLFYSILFGIPAGLCYLYGDLHRLSVPALGVWHSLSVVVAIIDDLLLIFGLLLQREALSADSHCAEIPLKQASDYLQHCLPYLTHI